MLLDYSNDKAVNDIIESARRARDVLTDWAGCHQSIHNAVNAVSLTIEAASDLNTIRQLLLSEVDELKDRVSDLKYRSNELRTESDMLKAQRDAALEKVVGLQHRLKAIGDLAAVS